jgi:hypothetical protein
MAAASATPNSYTTSRDATATRGDLECSTILNQHVPGWDAIVASADAEAVSMEVCAVGQLLHGRFATHWRAPR